MEKEFTCLYYSLYVTYIFQRKGENLYVKTTSVTMKYFYSRKFVKHRSNNEEEQVPVSYTHLTLPTNREV